MTTPTASRRAGAAGPAVEMVKLFQVQLEHYEKVQGETLSLEGKANQLGQLVRANLPAAMQGFAVVPLFAGYDTARERGRVFSYDVTGGRVLLDGEGIRRTLSRIAHEIIERNDDLGAVAADVRALLAETAKGVPKGSSVVLLGQLSELPPSPSSHVMKRATDPDL